MLVSDLLEDWVAVNIRGMLKRFQIIYRSDSDYLNKIVLLLFFTCRQGKGRSLMKPLRLHIFVTEPSR